MIHYKIQITNSKNCNGKHIEIEECDTDCNTIWCPWSICIIQNDDCITDISGNGICKGFQFRTRSCLKECNKNCTCEADIYGNYSKEIRDCHITNCLHIQFDCITPPQWRVEIDNNNNINQKNIIIQEGGNIGDNCIPVISNNKYLLIINRGCGTVKWHYKGEELNSFTYNTNSNHDYMFKCLPIIIPPNNNNTHGYK